MVNKYFIAELICIMLCFVVWAAGIVYKILKIKKLNYPANKNS